MYAGRLRVYESLHVCVFALYSVVYEYVHMQREYAARHMALIEGLCACACTVLCAVVCIDMFAFSYVCVYVRMYIYVYICIHMYMYVSVCICMYMYMYI